MDPKHPIVNIDKICRVCLTENDQMYSIYSELYESSDQITEGADHPCIYEILTKISSIKVHVDDGLPSTICTKCVDSAHSSFKFQNQCNQSQSILDEYLEQIGVEQIKHEDIDQVIADNDNNDELVNDFLLSEDGVIEQAVKNEQQLISQQTIEGIDDVDCLAPDQPEKLFSCQHCNKTYKHATSLRTHMRNHTAEKPYKCKICAKSFTQSSALVYHKRTHTGEQPHSCKLCGKRYKQSGTLTAHMRIHTGQRPFLCSICGRGFRQAPDLGYHMRSHTKEKPYMCNVCGKTMSMQSHLVQHMRIHTGEKPYKCDVCEKAFPSSTCLKRHSIVHTGLKPYTCDVCAKSFNRAGTLKVHSKIHTDERPHVCPICGKGFIQAHTMHSHLTTHSNEITILSDSPEMSIKMSF